MNAGQFVYAIATMDTKGDELDFVANCLRNAGVETKTVDVGTQSDPVGRPDVTRDEVLAGTTFESLGDDRGQAITTMSNALREYMLNECAQGHVAGVIGIGGSGGTALITTALRALEIGLPKFMVSTVASGNTAPYVDCSDIIMMYSVVDVAGLNAVSRPVLSNAAHAMAGMVSHSHPTTQSKPTVGLTMFGVTTPVVTLVRQALEERGYDCLVFHATGTGGRAMEQLVDSELIEGVLDITTTEVADELIGGVFPCGPQRFEKTIKRGVPFVLSLGALDMVNFGAKETVPNPFQDRNLYVHNAQVTLMRTTPDENRQFATWIADKLNQSTAAVTVLIPEKGVSALDAPGQPFHDPEADTALFETLESQFQTTDSRRIRRLPCHINDAEFAQAVVDEYLLLASNATT